MSKLFSLVFVFGILISGLDLGLVKSSVVTREDNSLVRVKRIIGGQIAEKHRNSVFAYLSHSRICTGTFIAPNMMLTAASCIWSSFALIPFTIYNEERSITLTVSKLHNNPFDRKDQSEILFPAADIAVIQFDKNVDSIRVAPLGYNYAISCNETVYQYGYDSVDPYKHSLSKPLKVFSAKVVECTWYTYYKHYIPFVHFEEPLTTEGIDGHSWDGEDGGPIFTKDDLIIGVSSYAKSFEKKTGKSARISKHKKFLQEILSQT